MKLRVEWLGQVIYIKLCKVIPKGFSTSTNNELALLIPLRPVETGRWPILFGALLGGISQWSGFPALFPELLPPSPTSWMLRLPRSRMPLVGGWGGERAGPHLRCGLEQEPKALSI